MEEGAEAVKARVRATVRRLRHENQQWYADLFLHVSAFAVELQAARRAHGQGPAAAIRLQEEQEAQLAPRKVEKPPTPKRSTVGAVSALADAVRAAEEEEAAREAAAEARRKAEEDAKYGDKAARRAVIPAKDLRARAMVQVARLQRYLEDLPPRQVVPPKSRPSGLPRHCTKGDVNGEIGRLEVSLNEGLVSEENTAAVLLQLGRLRDFVDDRPISRKRLRRLINKEVALPWMYLEAHRIIVSSLLRSGLDTDVDACNKIKHHILEWLKLTPDEGRHATLVTIVAWIRDRLHLDSFRITLLEEWAGMELEADAARLAGGTIQEPDAAVFLELCFHTIRQESYEDALKWMSHLIQLAPGSLQRLDETIGVTRRSTAGGFDTKGTPFDPFLYQTAEEDETPRPTRVKRKQAKPRPKAASMSGDKAAAVARAIEAARQAPGPGSYNVEDGMGKQALSIRRSAPAVSFGAKLEPAHIRKTDAPGPGAYTAVSTVGDTHIPISKHKNAPAAGFQSRTLFGSVYQASVRRFVGLPAPTSYVVDDYSHARARWRATQEAKRLMPFIKPVLRESQVPAKNPGILEHLDYAVHPRFAGDMTQPAKRIAPAPIGARPRPVLEASNAFTDKDALLGKYSGYSTTKSIRPGNAEERSRIMSGAVPAKVPGMAQLGGAPVFTRPRSPPKAFFASSSSPLPGEGEEGDADDSEDSDGPQLPVFDPSKSPTKSALARAKSRSGMREASTLPGGAEASASTLTEDVSFRADSPKAKKYDFKRSTIDSAAAAAASTTDVNLPNTATITGHVPAPFFGKGGVMTRSDRWQEAEWELERAASVPGPRYMLPALPSGPAYTAQGGWVKDDTVSSAYDGNGAGPGMCRSDSAFGSQVTSVQASAPALRFAAGKDANPVLNLRSLSGADDTHNKLPTGQAGMRATMSGVGPDRGLPGVGSYDPHKYTSMSAVVAKRTGRSELEAARASFVKRSFQ